MAKEMRKKKKNDAPERDLVEFTNLMKFFKSRNALPGHYTITDNKQQQ